MKKTIVSIAVAIMTVILAISCIACNNSTSPYTFGKEVISYNGSSGQMDVLEGMKKGDCDIGVIDSIMANYFINNNEYYKENFAVASFYLSNEEYGIGAKKGNDALTSKINEGLIALAANGEMTLVANQFGLASDVIVTANTENTKANATDASWNKVVESGKLIIGYTEFAPIAFEEGSTLTGYDIELAKAVVAYLNLTYLTNIEVEFTLIDWDMKESLLENGSIDLVWNGMTITDERLEGMSMSIPYLKNSQAIVYKKADAADYDLTSLDAFKESTKEVVTGVEAGSAGEEVMGAAE